MKKGPPADHPLRELCALCREGKLFEVVEWGKRGKPVHLAGVHHAYSPMWIAIDQNFHSLVKVLLDYGSPADADALWFAARKNRADIVKLLFERGANARSIHFPSLILFADREIVKMFVERGADIVTKYPVAEALAKSTREWCGLCKELLPKRPELMFQINMALRRFCYEGRLCLRCSMPSIPRDCLASLRRDFLSHLRFISSWGGCNDSVGLSTCFLRRLGC